MDETKPRQAEPRQAEPRQAELRPTEPRRAEFVDSTAFKLHRATVLLDRIADDYLVAQHRIHYAPFLVLLMARVLGPTTQQAIAQNLGVSRASVTQRVGVLQKSGLVDVAKSAADARANTVVLTAAGAELVEAAWQGLEQHQDGVDFGVDEPVLAAQLDRLIQNALGILKGGER
ncbi:MarR family winged helix-turn-helix transcriptional regulator [Conyzicola sp.]|uniref:MarR family winged helix-turn-helix transcriptional regulator n=1 Tax=Conyzicola sp. TaxID=1969404 RepID=UPI003988AF11